MSHYQHPVSSLLAHLLAHHDYLYDESGELNRRIIRELIRNGIDQLNKALRRLMKKGERQANKEKLTEAQKKLCRKTNVELMDLNVANLLDLVGEIDNKVTSFQKEVKQEILLSGDSHVETMDHDGDAFPADDETDEDLGVQRQKRRKVVTKDRNDYHPHASRKRKSSSASTGGASRTSSKQTRQHSTERVVSSSNQRRNATSSRQRTSSSARVLGHTSAATKDDDNMSIGSADFDTSMDFGSTDVDFVGDTDDIDDNQRSLLPAMSDSGRSASQKQQRIREAFHSGSSRGGSGNSKSRQSRPTTERMENWLQKQNDDGQVELEPGAKRKQSTISSGLNRQAPASGSSQIDQTSTRGTNNTRTAQQRQPQGSATSRTSQPRPRDTVHSNSTRRRQGGTLSRSKNNSTVAQLDDMESTTRPTVPRALSADVLFDTVFSQRSNMNEEQPMRPNNSRSLHDLCQELQDSFPNNLDSCRNVLTTITSHIMSKCENELHKHEIILLFQALLSVLQRKCTTLLDIIQTNPEVASVQMDCWCLIFRMFEKKLNSELGDEDGIIYKIFCKRTTMASYILLQIVDVLYSQLLWEEYGQTPPFHDSVFDQIRVLCIRISAVVPLLPSVCDILISKLSKPKWHKSLTIEQKENELAKVLFVSALDPEMHKRFLTLGVAMPELDKGVYRLAMIRLLFKCNAIASSHTLFLIVPAYNSGECRLRSFKCNGMYKIPREEIESIWSIIGFASCCHNMSRTEADVQKLQNLVSVIVFYKCGTLAQTEQQLPPPPLQIDTCSKEIEWICTLLSSKLFGTLPKLDKFVKQVIEKSVALEAFDKILNMFPVPSSSKVNKAVKQLWGYSCIVESAAELESDLQAGLFDLGSFFLATKNTNDVYCLSPSSVLLQRCVFFAYTYANIVMTKSVRRKEYLKQLQLLAAMFFKKAVEVESKSEEHKTGANLDVDAFAAMFQSIEVATEVKIEETQTSSHFREASCYIMLAVVVARSQCKVGDGNNFHLNKAFRENVSSFFTLHSVVD